MSLMPIEMSEYSKEVKSRYIKPFSIILAAMALFNCYIYHFIYKAPDLAVICFLCSLAAVFVPFVKRKSSSYLYVANYVVLVVFVCVTFLAVYTGGILSNAIWWLGALPLVASFLMNAFFGAVWFIIIMLNFLLIFYLGTKGLLPTNILMDQPPEGRMIVSFTLNSGLIAFLCVLADLIRDRAFLEKEELRLKTFQLNQMASLGKMASGIAHEINNPLTVIRGAQLRILRMIESPAPIDKSLLTDYMSKVHRNILRIQDVTGLLGTISEKARDRTVSSINVKKMLEDVIQMRMEEIHKYNITLVTKFPEEPLYYSGIFSEIFQSVLNIIEHAIYELRNSKRPLRHLKIEMVKTDPFVIILVEDDGEGIPMHLRHQIFDPFFKAKNYEDNKGLGLSFSYNVLNSLGGHLELLNSQQGTLFQISLPRHHQ